ncbi:MAG: ATP synthase F0 subunit C [Clostridiaceae bacterium]|jgi:F-type H+-transporting ATPase subunit c|nr:ATP synthase F0 subunit C [Clostridiaceae bacterium]
MEKSLVALAAALAIGAVGSIAAYAISKMAGKAFDSMARQPEVASRVQTSLTIAIVFIETCAIYALVVSLLLVFVF